MSQDMVQIGRMEAFSGVGQSKLQRYGAAVLDLGQHRAPPGSSLPHLPPRSVFSCRAK